MTSPLPGATATNHKAFEAVNAERVVVLDFGSQYAQLIARRVREQHVYCEIVRHDITAERLAEISPKGIILSGGPASIYEDNAPRCDAGLFSLGVPVLGICYGMQAACEALGGTVGRAESREYGRSSCDVISDSSLFSGVPTSTDVWMSHGDQVATISDDFIPLAKTATCPLAAVRHKTLPVFGLQFHPEVTHTPAGSKILANFLHHECGCTGTWRLEDFADIAIESIKRQVGSDRVICGLSGGVDSAVVAALISKAIGDKLSCILVEMVFFGRMRLLQLLKSFLITSRQIFMSFLLRTDSLMSSQASPSHRKSDVALAQRLLTVLRTKHRKSRMHASSHRERSILMLLRAVRLRTDLRQLSSSTTTLAAYQIICSLNLLNHFEIFSRTKYANSASIWGCQSILSGVIPFRDQVLLFDVLVK